MGVETQPAHTAAEDNQSRAAASRSSQPERMYPPEHRRRNFLAALIDCAGWGLGIGIISHDTFMPLFVSDLHGSGYAVGLIKTLLAFGWYVPGILVAGKIERLPRVKRSLMILAAGERAFLLALAPLCLWLGPHHRTALLWAFFLCWGGMTFTMGCNSPAYLKLIAKTVPPEWRGRMYGIGGAIAGLLGVLGARLATWLLEGFGYPGGYAACFGLAFVVQTLTVIPLGFMREPEGEAAPPEAHRPAELVRLLRDDPVLQGFILVGILFAANVMATAFYTRYAIDRFHVGVGMVGIFTGVIMASQIVANLLCGTVGDRAGNKRLLELGLLAGIVTPLLAWAAPGARWFYVVFSLNQIAVNSWGIAQINYVLELCGPERAATYTAVAGLLIGPFRAAAPLIGAWLVATAGYRPMFALTSGLTLLALAVSARRMLEPRGSGVQVFRCSGVQVGSSRFAGRESTEDGWGTGSQGEFPECRTSRTPERLNT
jgi:MFS family permease